jgi:hypothetical protein
MLKKKAAIFCDMASRSISLFQAFLMVLLIVFWGSSFVVGSIQPVIKN